MTERFTLTRNEVAQKVGLSKAAISAAIASGDLRAKRTGPKGKGNYLIRPADVDAWIESLEDA